MAQFGMSTLFSVAGPATLGALGQSVAKRKSKKQKEKSNLGGLGYEAQMS